MNRITNTTVISNFASVGRLDLLHAIVAADEHLYMPIEVYDEITAGQREGYTFYDDIEQHIAPFTTMGWLHLVTMTEQELTLFVTLPPQVHRGEGACLCIARQRNWGISHG